MADVGEGRRELRPVRELERWPHDPEEAFGHHADETCRANHRRVRDDPSKAIRMLSRVALEGGVRGGTHADQVAQIDEARVWRLADELSLQYRHEPGHVLFAGRSPESVAVRATFEGEVEPIRSRDERAPRLGVKVACRLPEHAPTIPRALVAIVGTPTRRGRGRARGHPRQRSGRPIRAPAALVSVRLCSAILTEGEAC